MTEYNTDMIEYIYIYTYIQLIFLLIIYLIFNLYRNGKIHKFL